MRTSEQKRVLNSAWKNRFLATNAGILHVTRLQPILMFATFCLLRIRNLLRNFSSKILRTWEKSKGLKWKQIIYYLWVEKRISRYSFPRVWVNIIKAVQPSLDMPHSVSKRHFVTSPLCLPTGMKTISKQSQTQHKPHQGRSNNADGRDRPLHTTPPRSRDKQNCNSHFTAFIFLSSTPIRNDTPD